MHNVIDVYTSSEPVDSRQRVVVQSDDSSGDQAGFSTPSLHLRRPDKFCIMVGAPWQEVQHIFGPNDGEQERFGIAIYR